LSADNGQDVAALHLCVGQDRNGGRDRTTNDAT
jgi:hypothetical protein